MNTNRLLSSIDFAKLAQVSYKAVIAAYDELIAKGICPKIQEGALERLLTYKDSLMLASILAVAPEQMLSIIQYWQIKTIKKIQVDESKKAESNQGNQVITQSTQQTQPSKPRQDTSLTSLNQSFLRLSKVIQRIHCLHVEQKFMPSCYRYVMPLSCLQGTIEVKIQLKPIKSKC